MNINYESESPNKVAKQLYDLFYNEMEGCNQSYACPNQDHEHTLKVVELHLELIKSSGLYYPKKIDLIIQEVWKVN